MYGEQVAGGHQTQSLDISYWGRARGSYICRSLDCR